MLSSDPAALSSPFAALPPTMPDDFAHAASPSSTPDARCRWSVVHASRLPTRLLSLAEAQAEIGMRPSVLAPSGWWRPDTLDGQASAPPSVVQEWRQVRRWRNLIVDENLSHNADVVHVHCFAAGMAALRAGCTVVYDLETPIGSDSRYAKPGPWLIRSLGVAENFVLARASAVVVHSHFMWKWALQKGVRSDDLFLVPQPIASPPAPPFPAIGASQLRPFTFFAGPIDCSSSARLDTLLQAFAMIAEEVGQVCLVVEADAECAGMASACSSRLGIGEQVRVVAPEERHVAMQSADLVIAIGSDSDAPNTALAALARGRALLAPDTPALRDITPDGRGCLWYRAGSARDLAFRAAFLARNPDLRAALGRAGRDLIQLTRTPLVAAREYLSVYRHAMRRDRRTPGAGNLRVIPALQLV